MLNDFGLNAVVSGDLAADAYALWQLPTTVHIYRPEIIDPTVVGFSPVEPTDATMTIVVPEDPTVAHVASAFGARQGKWRSAFTGSANYARFTAIIRRNVGI